MIMAPNALKADLKIIEKSKNKSVESVLNTNHIKTKNEVTNNSRQKYKCFLGEFETKIYWGNTIGMALLHIGALVGFLYCDKISLTSFIYALVVGGMAGFGVTGGAHRYWTHKCYKAKLPLKIILLICYSVGGQNTLLEWVRDHRVHHMFSETDADPHNANRGFLFSHAGWLCMQKHPEVIRKGKSVDVGDISSDPLLAFYIRHWMWFKLIFCFILPITIAPYLIGESWKNAIIFQGIIRYCVTLNFTWSVNSFAHIWGNRPYNKNIQPAENKFVAFVALGEGFHNYHHSFPWDYRTAEIGSFLNISTFWINVFAKIGWAYDLKTTSPILVANMIKNKGDGSHNKT